MNHTHVVLLASCLAAGCASSPPALPNMSFDNRPAKATVTASGTRQLVEIWIDPDHATLGGETFGSLDFRLELWQQADCSDCSSIQLDGKTISGSFVYGDLTYDIGDAPSNGGMLGPCPLTQEGDPLQLQRGSISGRFDFSRLDGDGGQLSITLAPTFGVGFPYPGVVHVIAVAAFDVAFQKG